ncbi:MAG TPA: hypothetical protein VLL05_12240, partial [Terriglobales bacterium]|nr:hypothetical protein [Terriglobales bacterium]
LGRVMRSRRNLHRSTAGQDATASTGSRRNHKLKTGLMAGLSFFSDGRLPTRHWLDTLDPPLEIGFKEPLYVTLW